MDINDCTDKELQQELNRRKRTAEKKAHPKQLPSEDINWAPLLSLCEENLQHISKEKFEQEDMNQWMYEAVYEAVYGNSVFDWMNERTK